MKKFMSSPRAFGALILSIALALVACGGGGDSSPTPTTPVVDTNGPVLTLATAAPLSTTGSIVVTANEPLNGSGIIVTVKNGAATVPVTTSFGIDGKTETIRPVTSWPDGSVLTITASASDTSGNVGTASFTLATEAIAWWPPKNITPVGVKVFGASQIPAGCTSWFQQCWKDLVKNGGMKFIETPQVMTGINSRSIVFAFYKNANGLWSTLPIYRDTGELVGSEISGGVSLEYDWVQGTARGIIVHEKVSGNCYETAYYPPTTQPGVPSAVWANTQVSCP